jgi:hypothetical protein
MSVVLRIAGFLLGYLISGVSSFLLFTVSRHAPHQPASPPFISFAAIYGVAFAFFGGWVAAKIGGHSSGVAVGIIIAVMSVFSAWYDHAGSHWSQWVAVLLMAPAAVIGANFATKRVNIAANR